MRNPTNFYRGTRLAGRAQPWARLLVLCSTMGLAGPSNGTWAWSSRLFNMRGSGPEHQGAP